MKHRAHRRHRQTRRHTPTLFFVGLALTSSMACQCGPIPCKTTPQGSGFEEEVCLPGGSFTMGSDPIPITKLRVLYSDGGTCPASAGPDDCYVDRSPAPRNDFAPKHTVHLNPFFMGRYEVTVGLYRKCVEAGVCHLPDSVTFYNNGYYENPDNVDRPVLGVHWEDARNYCLWKGKRLPTEAEWERAARGPQAFDYPWGNEQPPREFKEAGRPPYPIVGTTPLDVSPEGIHDLEAEPQEWVADWYDPKAYASGPYDNPTGPAGPRSGRVYCCVDNDFRIEYEWDGEKVVRGVGPGEDSGGREWGSKLVPLWFRYFDNPKIGGYTGFRCVRDDISGSTASLFPIYNSLSWKSFGRTR